MTFGVYEAIDGITNAGTQSKFLRKATTNPFYAAITIVVILMLTVLIVFRNAIIEDQSLWGLMCRTGIYSFAGVLVVMYLHNHFMTESFQYKTTGGAVAPLISDDVSKMLGNIVIDDQIMGAADEDEDALPTFL